MTFSCTVTLSCTVVDMNINTISMLAVIYVLYGNELQQKFDRRTVYL